MPNLNSVASILQGLNDQQLQMEMKNPSGSVPQFLVMSEMQRRQQMRAEAAPVAPAPQTTVADDIMQQEAVQQGVAGMPQMASGQDAPGGVASFAEGGMVSRYPSGGPPDVRWWTADDWNKYAEEQGFGEAARGVKKYAKDRFKELSGAVGQFRDWANKPRDFVAPDKTSAGLDGPSGDRTYMERANSGFANEFNRAKEIVSPSVARAATPRPGVPAMAGGLDGPAGDLSQDVRRVEAEGLGANRVAGAARSGIASIKGMPADVESSPLGGPLPRPRELDMPGAPPSLEDPQMKQAQDYLEMVRQQNPDMIKPLIDAANARVEANKKGRKDAASMALMQAGLGMMASKSPSFMGGVGEGGLGGLRAYAEQMKGVNDRDMDIQRQRDNLALAQAEASRGNFKTAADLANASNRDMMTLHGHKRQERRDDIQNSIADRRLDAQIERVDREIDQRERHHQDDVRYKNKALGVRAVRGGGGGGSGGGGGGGGSSKEGKAALSEYNKLVKRYQAENRGALNPDPSGAHQFAMNNLNPNMHKYILQMYSGGVGGAQPQQKILKLGSSGFYQ